MKNLFVILAVLAMVSFASAGTVWLTADDSTVAPGQSITISMLVDTACNAGVIADWVDSDKGGTASNMALHANIVTPKSAGTAGGSGNTIVQYIYGSAGSGTPVPANGTLWSMTYTVKSSGLNHGDIIHITAGGSTEINFNDDTMADSIGGVNLEVVIPEPMTIALLGLGGLFLRRKLS